MATHETIIVADDHPLFRTAMQQAVDRVFKNPAIVAVEDLDGLQQAIAAHADADMLLLDLNMPGCRGYSALVYARHAAPSLPVVVISALEDGRVVHAAMEHGAAGFIPKSVDMATMVSALETVHAGGVWLPQEANTQASEAGDEMAHRIDTLTPQQLRVLLLIIDGKLNKQIAFDLDISEATVKAHVTAILHKLGVYTRTQAVIAVRSLEIDWGAMTKRNAAVPE